MLTVHGITRFLILVFMYLKYVIFVFILDEIFCGTSIFLGQFVASKDILMCSLLFHSSLLPGQRSLRKRISAVLIFCTKKLSSQIVVSTSFWSWLLNISSVLTSLKFTATICWCVNAF